MEKQQYMPPKTSLAAHAGVIERGQKVTHADIILKAMKRFKRGNYVQIAAFSGLKELQVVRRLSEMERLSLIRRTGKFAPTSSTDVGEIWEIVEGEPETQNNQPKTHLFTAVEIKKTA